MSVPTRFLRYEPSLEIFFLLCVKSWNLDYKPCWSPICNNDPKVHNWPKLWQVVTFKKGWNWAPWSDFCREPLQIKVRKWGFVFLQVALVSYMCTTHPLPSCFICRWHSWRSVDNDWPLNCTQGIDSYCQTRHSTDQLPQVCSDGPSVTVEGTPGTGHSSHLLCNDLQPIS